MKLISSEVTDRICLVCDSKLVLHRYNTSVVGEGEVRVTLLCQNDECSSRVHQVYEDKEE